jgi:DNA-binding transcriptional LysR family regulator
MRPGRHRQLLYLATVAEEGQITRAATKLKVGRSALSEAIAHLESEIGVQLLERRAGGVSMTPAGDVFLARARAALEVEDEAAHVAQALARAESGALTIGFIGPPPMLTSQDLLASFSEANPDAQVSFQDLAFPSGSTATWLLGVDAAICHQPALEANVRAHALRAEPRAVIAQRDHPLAKAKELEVSDVLDATFVSYHRDVQRDWAGFHSLDDARAGPPAHLTDDRVLTTLQMLAVMSSSPAITTVPLGDARLAEQVMPTLAAIPVVDAAPAKVSLVWRRDNRNPLLEAIVAAARSSTPGADGV